METAAWGQADHAGMHRAIRGDRVTAERHSMAIIAGELRLEDGARARAAVLPHQRRRPLRALPARGMDNGPPPTVLGRRAGGLWRRCGKSRHEQIAEDLEDHSKKFHRVRSSNSGSLANSTRSSRRRQNRQAQSTSPLAWVLVGSLNDQCSSIRHPRLCPARAQGTRHASHIGLRSSCQRQVCMLSEDTRLSAASEAPLWRLSCAYHVVLAHEYIANF